MSAPKYLCPCGDRLWTREELHAEGDELATYIADAHLSDGTAFCAGEDDVLFPPYMIRNTRLGRLRWRARKGWHEIVNLRYRNSEISPF